MTVPTNAQCAGVGGRKRVLPRPPSASTTGHCFECLSLPLSPYSSIPCSTSQPSCLLGIFSGFILPLFAHSLAPLLPACSPFVPLPPSHGYFVCAKYLALNIFRFACSLSLFLAVSPRQLPFSLQASGWRKCRHYTVRKCVANL